MGKKALKLMLGSTLKNLGYKGTMLEKNLSVISD